MITDMIVWWSYVAWFYIRRTYNDLPGPAWLKIALVVICLAIPGPQDELALLAIVALCRWYRARRAGRTA